MYKMIITTTDSLEIVDKITNHLLESNLSPCIQIIDKVESKYLWEGEIKSQKEYLILIKCKACNAEGVSEYIKNNHNYNISEVIEIDINILNEKYKKWFDSPSM